MSARDHSIEWHLRWYQMTVEVITLTSFLARPYAEASYLVEGLWPAGGYVMLVAPAKAGKSTMIGNLLRSLADGEPFLGRYAVQPGKRVALIDTELSQRQLQKEMRLHRVTNTDAIKVIPARGKAGAFDLTNPAQRHRIAESLVGIDVLILDCLRPCLDALGLNENTEAGRFVEGFKALMGEAGIGQGLIVHHTGHGGERARGDSSLLGSTDANWLVTKKDSADHRSSRYFQAWGRDDVDVPESRLEFDRETRSLTVHDGGRNEDRADDIFMEVFDFVSKNPGLSKTKIREKLGFDHGAVGKALDTAVENRREVDGWYMERAPRPGRGGGFTYSLTRPNPSEPVSKTEDRMVTEPVFPVSKETGNGQYPVKPQIQENRPADKPTKQSNEEELNQDVAAILAQPPAFRSRKACTTGLDAIMTQARWNRANKHIKDDHEVQMEFEDITRSMESGAATK